MYISEVIIKPNKHDRYLEGLCRQIRRDYDLILRNIPLFSPRRRLVGEIDILAIKGSHYDVYEVKCSFRISKARRQLEKIKKHPSVSGSIRNMFFYCGESAKLELV